MRASRYLRQRAAQRSVGYNLAVLVNDVMPQIVNTMWTMHSTQKIQLRTLSRALDPSTKENDRDR